MDYGMVSSQDAGIEGGIGAAPDGGVGHTTLYVNIATARSWQQKSQPRRHPDGN
jgi:hypothetical protein